MLWRVALVLLYLSNAQELGPRGRRLPPGLRRPFAMQQQQQQQQRARMPPTPQADSGSTYYQNGYQGYPAQQQQTYQDGYREATSSGSTTQQFQSSSSSQSTSSSSSGQTAESSTTPSSSSGSSSSSTRALQPSATVFTATSGTFPQSSQSTFPQSSQSTLIASTGASTFPQASLQTQTGKGSASVSTSMSSSVGSAAVSSSSGSSVSSSSTFPQASASQPIQFPSSTFPSSGQTSLSSSQPISGQPLSSSGQPISGQPITSGQPLVGQPLVGQPLSPQSSLPLSNQPLSSQPPLTGQPLSSNQPLTQPLPAQPLPPQPAPTPAPFVPPYIPKDYDMRGCYTDTTWCPTTMTCVPSAFFNVSCPNYREPIYLNSINLECSAEAQAMWMRLNYSGSKSPPQPPYLSSWQDTPFRSILLDFISRVTNPALDSYVPRDQRVACFDNDGTVWIETPMLNQVAFLLWFVKRFPDPGQVLQNQLAGYLDGTTRGDPMSAVLSGLSVDMYNDFIRIWLEETRHPTFGRPYTDLVYAPMVDLINLMQAACFNVFIVSGGENLFMRALIPKVYGVPTQNIVGSFMELRYEESIMGTDMEFKIYPRTPVVVDRALKPVAIQRNVGRQPIFAFGNSDGDFEMLRYSTDGPGVRLGCLLRHDDAAREVVYEGHLTRSIEAAPANGWLFPSMKKDFKDVFLYNKQPANVIYMPRPRTPAPTQPPTPRAAPYTRPIAGGVPMPLAGQPITAPAIPGLSSTLPFAPMINSTISLPAASGSLSVSSSLPASGLSGGSTLPASSGVSSAGVPSSPSSG